MQGPSLAPKKQRASNEMLLLLLLFRLFVRKQGLKIDAPGRSLATLRPSFFSALPYFIQSFLSVYFIFISILTLLLLFWSMLCCCCVLVNESWENFDQGRLMRLNLAHRRRFPPPFFWLSRSTQPHLIQATRSFIQLTHARRLAPLSASPRSREQRPLWDGSASASHAHPNRLLACSPSSLPSFLGTAVPLVIVSPTSDPSLFPCFLSLIFSFGLHRL